MNPSQIVQEAISEYGRPLWVAHVPQAIRVQVPVAELAAMLQAAHTSPSAITRNDQYDSIIKWCRTQLFAEVTLEDLEKVSGLCQASVRKFVGERSDLFRKLRRGVWEVRDPEADREADKR